MEKLPPVNSHTTTDAPQGSIVRRLRLSLLGVAGLMAIAMITGLIGFLSATKSHGELVDQTLPILIKAEAISRNLSETTGVASTVRAAEDTNALAQLRQKLTVRLDDIALLIDAESWQQRMVTERVAMRRELDLFSTSTFALIDERQRILVAEADLALHVADLVEISQRVDIVTKPAMVKSSIALDGQLQTLEKSGRLDKVELAGLRKKLSDFTLFSQILGELESALNLAISTGDLAFGRDEADILSRAEFSIRTATQLLATLPKSDMRTDMANIIHDLRQIVNGPTGIHGILQVRSAASVAVRALQQETVARIGTLAELSNQLVTNANRDIARSQTHLEAVNLRTGVLTGISFILAFLLIGGLVVFVVERQINGRVQSLTHAVRRIAAGDVEHPVDVKGDDELGKMGDALAVFKQNAQELQRSNADLRTFAYVASHDLRSPLRAIRDLAIWTIEDAGDALPEDCRENLDLLLARVERMSRLLGDLLDYAQVGNVEASSDRFDLAERVAHLSDLVDPTRKFTINVVPSADDLATYITPLDQILLNLLTNAIKHHDQPNGEIWVAATCLNGRIRFSVRDDGPGIPAQFHQRIFDLFQTLKSRDEVEGSGLGLAMVVRLVGQYGGKIAVFSDPEVERGTTFTFDLPSTIQTVIDRAA